MSKYRTITLPPHIESDMVTTCDRLSYVTVGEPTDRQGMRLVEESGALDFWDHPDEDLYGPDDGEAIG